MQYGVAAHVSRGADYHPPHLGRRRPLGQIFPNGHETRNSRRGEASQSCAARWLTGGASELRMVGAETASLEPGRQGRVRLRPTGTRTAGTTMNQACRCTRTETRTNASSSH